jgi:trehalose 6-phosphate synthase/phosphatase
MLGSDFVGFHTDGYARNFMDCAAQFLGARCDESRGTVRFDGRTIKVIVIPVGIDAHQIYSLVGDQEVRANAQSLRSKIGAQKLVLGIDRLDYTKGIDRRLRAIDLLLQTHSEWREKLVFTQIAAPSREEVAAYAQLRRDVEYLVGHINGKWSTPGWTPIKLICRSFGLKELVQWYLAADVALVTPLKDGMNLVAKEYCAAHRDDPGVLVLSEFAGAAVELNEALLTNPYDIQSMCTALVRALDIDEGNARVRMKALNKSIVNLDAREWANRFLAEAGCA